MINPDDQRRIDQARADMESATAETQAVTAKNYRLVENKAVDSALDELAALLRKSPVKSRDRSIAVTAIEDASMRLFRDSFEASR